MVFEFRRIRMMQFFLGVGTVSAGLGCAAMLATAAFAGLPLMFLPALALIVLFVWLLSLVFRLPNSFVRVGEAETRVRFGGIVDVSFPNSTIREARLARHHFWGGLGARVTLGGIVVLSAVTGDVAELELESPVRIWLIPLVLPVRTTRLRLGVRRPERLVARLNGER